MCGSGHCCIDLLEFPILDIELTAKSSIALVFLILNCAEEPIFNKIRSWLLSSFSIILAILSVLVDPQRARWPLKSPNRINGPRIYAIKS